MPRNFLKRNDLILRAIAEAPNGLTASELKAQLGLPRSSIYRLLLSLTKLEYLHSNLNGRYTISSHLERIFINETKQIQSGLLNEALRKIADLTSETAFYAHFDGANVQLINATLPTMRDRPYVYPEFGDRPLTICSSALAILAYQSPKIVGQLKQNDLLYQNFLHLNSTQFKSRLKHIRTIGYAICDGDLHPDIMSVSFPLVRNDIVTYSIGIVGFSTRLRHLDFSKYKNIIHDSIRSEQTPCFAIPHINCQDRPT